MKKTTSAKKLVAPCGINCNLCLAFQRDKNKCSGCRAADTQKPNHCKVCSIKTCEELALTKSGFCYECPKYPCARIKRLDKRYQAKYKMSVIENQKLIKMLGLNSFMLLEMEKWKYSTCGGLVCVHRGCCLECGEE